jgi:hypothetical protein
LGKLTASPRRVKNGFAGLAGMSPAYLGHEEEDGFPFLKIAKAR